MPKRQIELFVTDIFVALDVIKRYTSKTKTVSALMGDETASHVVTRQLHIVGEAMKHILDDEAIKLLVYPEWRKIVNFRNVVVHEYFGLLYEQVFDIIKNKVPELEQQLISFCKKYPNQQNLLEAINDLQNELHQMHRVESIAYLESLKEHIQEQRA